MRLSTQALAALAICGAMTTAALAQSAPYRTDRYCINESAARWTPEKRRIGVRLHTSLLRICGAADADACGADDALARRQLEAATRTALRDFAANSGADIDLYFDGWTSGANRQLGRIVVADHARLVKACPGLDRGLANNRKIGPGRLLFDHGLVLFCRTTQSNVEFRWTPWRETDSGVVDDAAFIPVLRHEILHVLGLGHPDIKSGEKSNGCAVAPSALDSSIMTRPMRVVGVGREEGRFLRDHFGAAARSMRIATSGDGQVWAGLADPSTDLRSSPVIGDVSVAGGAGGARILAAWRSGERTIETATYTPFYGWRDITSIETPDSDSPPAIAMRDDGALALAYLVDDRLTFRVGRDGAAWSRPEVFAVGAEKAVSLVSDPASGEWLAVMTPRPWSGQPRRIRYFAMRDDDTPDMLPRDVFEAVGAPSIACGPPAQAGRYNCLMAWRSADWFGTYRWSACRVATRQPARPDEAATAAPSGGARRPSAGAVIGAETAGAAGAMSRTPAPPSRGDLKLDCRPPSAGPVAGPSTPQVAWIGGDAPWQMAAALADGSIAAWSRRVDGAWTERSEVAPAGAAIGGVALGVATDAGGPRRFVFSLAD